MQNSMSNRDIRQKLEDILTEPVRDPLWKHIYLTPGLKTLASSPSLIKLGSVKQLGPTWFVYPGATHTRLSHSFGVYEVAKKIILKILSHPLAPRLTWEGVNSFLAACLLHDTGHFPYAHSLKELPLKEHEEITAELILSEPIKSIISGEIGGDVEMTAAIVDKNRLIKESTSPHQTNDPLNSGDFNEVLFYRNILSGVLDPDRLDYLSRDAFFCGIPYGHQDIDYVIDRIIPDGNRGIAVDRRGIEAIENILFSKYLMFKSVYWHKTVRIATAMIKKAILMGLKEGLIQPADLYHLDDYQFSQQFQQDRFKYGKLVSMTDQRKFYRSVLEIPFDVENPLHQQLTDLDFRLAYEKTKAIEWGCEEMDIIIDIPEPISFETKLRIFENGEFHQPGQMDSIFNEAVIQRFRESLRKIRIFIHPDLKINEVKL